MEVILLGSRAVHNVVAGMQDPIRSEVLHAYQSKPWPPGLGS